MTEKRENPSSISSDRDIPQPKRSARRAAPPTIVVGVHNEIQHINIDPVGEDQHEDHDYDEVDYDQNQHDKSDQDKTANANVIGDRQNERYVRLQT